MIIKAQGGIALYNWDDVSNIHVTSGQNRLAGIQADQRDGKGGKLAQYGNMELARQALDMLYISFRDGERAFEFPPEDELRQVMIHRSTYRTKANRHGGS